ncbi:MAG: LTA synthase family protein [Chitinophagaceae bacterium]|nr:MAG: LTA synthase family protein [Chitinophagaceae bacterium]
MPPLKKIIAREYPAVQLLLKLLILLWLVKTIFFLYNYRLSNGWEISNAKTLFAVLGWALYYDLLCTALVLLPFFLALLLPVRRGRFLTIAAWISVGLGTFAVMLNIVDIFYFAFHRQRADADLLYVLRNPFQNGPAIALIILVAGIILLAVVSWILMKQFKRLIKVSVDNEPFYLTTIFLLCLIASLFVGHSKRMLPNRPLTDVTSKQLPLTQNSLHSFLYSLYRSKEAVIPSASYFPANEQTRWFNNRTLNTMAAATPKNVVLFIMESVPYEFFDSNSPYKVPLPFLDSLLTHSSFYSNAFSYSYNSNKGITAILTGLPTLTDIPLYHSPFAGITKTSIGERLAATGYSSSFFIGDNFDDFGFAKCCNWTGIQHYYCMQDVPGYKKLPKHTMGLHDEYMIELMQEKLKTTPAPFFTTLYNISTHYPNDLTPTFRQQTSSLPLSAPAKSMLYYDQCLSNFFSWAATQPWYSNTVFIFCSDHWARPDDSVTTDDVVNSFRIPIFIFDPSINKKSVQHNLVSQLDIMNTVLSYSGSTDSITSYGKSLLEQPDTTRTIFTKVNNGVYQAINSRYVLGFDADAGRALYCFDYIADAKRERNLLSRKNSAIDSIQNMMKAFLQSASNHYRNR